jgi:predicted ribosomally synthesized peptide with SipW-like signal peptide
MHMNKKILKGALAGTAVIALAAGGGTWASWSDFGVVTGNEAGAGILKLDVSARDGAGLHIAPFSLAPGQNKAQEFFLASANSDNVPVGALSAKLQNLKDTEDGGPACTTNSEAIAEAPGDADPVTGLPTNPLNDCGSLGELSSQLSTQILYSDPVADASSCPNTGIYTHGIGTGHTLAQQVAAGSTALGNVSAGQGVCVRIEMSLPTTATNAVQGDDVSFDYRFDLVQVP